MQRNGEDYTTICANRDHNHHRYRRRINTDIGGTLLPMNLLVF